MVADLTDPCGACDGWEGSIRPFCPGDELTEDHVPIEVWQPAAPELADWDAPCINGDCPPAEPLEPTLSIPTRTDSGLRTLLNLRFQYFDADEDVEEPIDGCFGLDFVVVFEVWSDNDHGEVYEGLCTARPLVQAELTECFPHDFNHCLFFPEIDLCSTDVEGSTAALANVESVRSAQARNFTYCQPQFTTRRSCLAPVLPIGRVADLILKIETGVTALQNLRVEIHPAYDNVPAPETCEGHKFYRNHATCAMLLVGGPVPANSTLVVDGRRRQALLYCSGGEAERAENLIEAWSFSGLDPGCRYWVTTIADCINTAQDATFDIAYAPRFQP
jgi:hypothetical protein